MSEMKKHSIQSSRTSLKSKRKSRPQSAASRVSFADELQDPAQKYVDFSPRNQPSRNMTSDITPAKSSTSLKSQSYQQYKAAPKNQPVGRWTRFSRGVRGLWKTNLINDAGDDREQQVKTTLRELAIYLTYIIILCIMGFMMLNPAMFYLTKVIRGLFVDGPGFAGITDMDKFWSYAFGGFVDGIYKETYYNGKDVHHTEIGYIYFENKIIGKPRIRQIRVRNDTCKIAPNFEEDIEECYGGYTEENEDKKTFGPGIGTPWNYQTPEQLAGKSFRGRLYKYGGGGYTALLTGDSYAARSLILSLKRDRWLDRGTRAVFIDFTVYNANINLFCIVKLLLEFPPTGGCITYNKFSTIKLLRYVTSIDYFVMACEGIFILFLIYFTIEELIEMKIHKFAYLKDFWSIFDLTVILLGYTTVIFNLYRTFHVSTEMKKILANRHRFANVELLGYYQELFNDIVAVTMFVSWMKVFKYISFNKTMVQLQGTLMRCAKDVAAFAVMFCIIFFAYSQWGYLVFGYQVRDFSTFMGSSFTLFRIILGDFDFNAMTDAHRVLGPLFFISYIFMVFFILLNMFLAIINDTYAEVKDDIEEEGDDFDIGEMFKKSYDNVINMLSFQKGNIVDLRKALQESDANEDNMIDYEEWRAALKARGHADAEIDAVFSKYDLDGDRMLNEYEWQRMQDDLDGQEAEVEAEIEETKQKKEEAIKMSSKLALRDEDGEESESDAESEGPSREISKEEFKVLIRRVDRAEHSVGSIVSKIEAVLIKLEGMDKAKVKRRETMGRLLESIAAYESQVTEEADLLSVGGPDRWDSEASVKRGGTSLSQKSRPPTSLSKKSRIPTAVSRKSETLKDGSTLFIKFDP